MLVYQDRLPYRAKGGLRSIAAPGHRRALFMAVPICFCQVALLLLNPYGQLRSESNCKTLRHLAVTAPKNPDILPAWGVTVGHVPKRGG